VTGTFTDGSGNPLGGSVTFTPSTELSGPAGEIIITQTAVVASVSSTTGEMTATLACTDNATLFPQGWTWNVGVAVPGAVQAFSVYLPHTLGPAVDLSALNPVGGIPSPSGTYVISVNGLSGSVSGMLGPGSMSASADAIASGSVIATSAAISVRVDPPGAVTGVILEAGTAPGQMAVVVNESGNSVAFAAAGTSNVADGVSDVIAGNTARAYIWDGGTALWYRLS
jgi:hypothetical protein